MLADGWYAETENGSVALSEASRPAADCLDTTLRLVNTLPVPLPDDMSLCFQTKNESVRVWVDGILTYTYGEAPQRVYGHGVGAVWNLVPLPENADGATITVSLTPIGGRTGLSPYTFLLGNQSTIVTYLLHSRLALLIVSVLLALIGIAAFIICLAWTANNDVRASAAFYFSLLVLLSTVWMLSDSGLLQFVIPNKGISYLLFGCSFYLLPTSLALFLAYMQPRYSRLYRMISIVTSSYALLRILLYMAGLVNFETALWVLHLLMAVIILSTNLSLWLPAIRTKRLELPELSIAVSVFMLAESISLADFYLKNKMNMLRNGYSSGFYVGILLFVLITIIGLIRRAQALRQQAFKAMFLERRAYTDDLTGLLNVKGFDDKCAELLRDLPEALCCAVVDFDVNFFSQYNATNGVDAGDAMLKSIAALLSSNCRNNELCARQEADHFVCLLCGESFDAILARVRSTDQSVRSQMTAHMLLLSYGIVEITDRSLPIPALRNQAAVAKRTVKGNYENNIAIYDHKLHEAQIQEVAWLSGFEKSLQNNEYVIFLQPKIDIRTEQISGAEALVRRIEPDGSVMSAGPIIDALEHKGFITKLDYYVLEQVCGFLRRCLAEGRKICPISCNFSRVHLYNPDFPDQVVATVDRYGISHALVEIELTETAFLVGKDILQTQVRRLRDNGFSVAIDDFGTGYSSLTMLKDVEIDVIKLDQEFLADFETNRRADTVIAHTLHLAQKMQITAVAEGIETFEQLDFLRNVGCTLVQGYYYSRPLPEDVFIEKYLPLA
ncbi:MAG: EAL domain-containing protein [Clostridia bacterium]|nr:EAL domain-containing protein [Clostridia bacterium]